ncbi:tetratricopeptide repeat protein [Cronbergia sp. UHCC 0137]|uniref:tetratricopeptide repeat-containing sulfotransferase family protein n=1 Tax=Cronbergia sp. UHCC 0137 TaxID=3110239 RepID=UPI002B1EA982|nr:tetratricopeptide repeat protein [Cronbergia sp. UHCC 0137]MEA5619902.1 tetratricopeptide repeat protein [Cronbergia sp. UHCC 0137]
MNLLQTLKQKKRILGTLRNKLKITYYQAVIQLKPTLPEPHFQLGKFLAERKDYPAAIACYEKAITHKHPEPWKVYYCLGNTLKKSRRFELAISAYQNSVAINPEFFSAYQEMAESFLQMSQWDMVIKSCKNAIKVDPNIFWVHYYLGKALLRKKNWEEAIQAFQQAIAIDPCYYYTYQFLSEAYQSTGQHEEDAKAWKYGIKHNPKVSEFYRGLGDVLTQQNQIPEAIAAYRQASQMLIQVSHPHIKTSSQNITTLTPPNFIIIGITKGGTTSLYSYLTKHPQILPAIRKEINFWINRQGSFDRGLDWYCSHFPQISPDQTWITGEATPFYLFYSKASERLAQVFPQTKLILLLRNPIDRAVSHYYMNVAQAREDRSLETALISELDFLKTHPETDWVNSQIGRRYLIWGLYLKFIQEWLEWFPREQFLILKSEDLFKDPNTNVNQIFEFLGVKPYKLPSYPIENKGYYAPVSESLSQDLSVFFKPHNQALEQFLGQKFNWD